MSELNFQVNLQGMIELLSKHLYANPGVFVRELLQNGVDAITARKRLGHRFDAGVTVELYGSRTIAVHDNGIGLSEQEIHRFLAQIGSTSKREELDSADDFIGQFGVGLLSCFVVSGEIVVITRSALEGDTLEWRGRSDGTYKIRKLEKDAPIGTTVFLTCKDGYEDYYEWDSMSDLMTHYGQYLPVPIRLSEGKNEITVNEETPPWAMSMKEALAYGEYHLYQNFLDAIPLKSGMGELEGVAYILPYAVSLQAEKKHKVYVKRMLLSDQIQNMLPDWAFFVTCVMNANGLKPTASRESLMENELFYSVKDELGECIKRHMIMLAETDPDLLEKIIRIHYSSIKAMASQDDELYRLFIRFLTFETSFGEMRMGEILEKSRHIVVSSTLDEFRQVARVAKAQDVMVINGGYVHDFELVRKLPELDENIEAFVLDPINFSNFFEAINPVELLNAEAFLELSDRLLAPFQCRSVLKQFEPADLAALYNTNDEVNFLRMAEQTKEEANDVFADIVDIVINELYELPLARLCYNFNNPLIRKAIACNDASMQRLCIETVYTQALLLGNYPLGPEELKLLNQSFMQVLDIGLGQAGER